MAKNIKDYFKPSTDVSSRCPTIPPTAVRASQKEIQQLEKTSVKANKKRGPYQGITEANKTKIAKRAAELGVTTTLRYFKKTGEFDDLKESTVRGWMNAYEKELSKGEQSSVPTVPTQRRGRPLLLGEELEEQVKAFLLSVRSSGGIVNAPFATAVARGIVTTRDANLLAENGGPVNLTREWAKRLLGRMGLVKCKANTSAAKVMPKDFDEL